MLLKVDMGRINFELLLAAASSLFLVVLHGSYSYKRATGPKCPDCPDYKLGCPYFRTSTRKSS
jgi:hypothetical protein